MLDLGITFSLLIIAIIAWLIKCHRENGLRYGNLPVVPLCLPILGHLPYFGTYSHKTFVNWARKYGNIYRIQLGLRPAVVVNGHREVKLITNMTECSVRPNLQSWGPLQPYFGFNSSFDGIRIRKKVIHAIASVKHHRFSVEVDKCCDQLVEKWLHYTELGSETQKDLESANSEVVFNLCYGGTASDEDKIHLAKILELQDEFSKLIHVLNMVDSFPILLKIHPGIRKTYQSFLTQVEHSTELTNLQIKRRLQERAEVDLRHVENVFDGLRSVPLINSEGSMIDRDRLMLQIQTVNNAGLDTISSTLNWIITMLCKYPSYQAEIWEEIKTETEPGQIITEQDRAVLVKLEAFINEVLRYISPLPFAIPHCTTEDVHLKDGMIIPKDTFMFINLWSANHDEQVWTTPEKFQPERFVYQGALNKKKIAQIMSFSHGRRRCVAVEIAYKIIFLFTANILRRCELSFARDSENVDIDRPEMGMTLRPPASNTVARLRSE